MVGIISPLQQRHIELLMLYTISWFLILTLLAIWSMGVWVLHSFAVWSIAGVGMLVNHSQPVERLMPPGWVALWMPSDFILAIKEGSTTVLPWIQSVLAEFPSAANWFSPLAWLLWSIGFVVLVIVGVVFHALISMVRRTGGATGIRTESGDSRA